MEQSDGHSPRQKPPLRSRLLLLLRGETRSEIQLSLKTSRFPACNNPPHTHRQTLGFTNLVSGGFSLEAELQEIMGCFEVGIILRWNPTINAMLLHPASKSLQERGLCSGTTPQTSSFFTQNCLVLIHPPQDHSWCSQSIPVLGGGCSTWSRALNSRNPTFHRGKNHQSCFQRVQAHCNTQKINF